MKSIKDKFLVVVVAGLFIMTMAVSTICFATMTDILRKDADKILENRCEKEAAQMNDIMNDIVNSVYFMEHFATTELFSPQALKVDKYLQDYLEKMEDMFDQVAHNTKGVVNFRFRIRPEITNKNTGFYKGVVSNNGNTEFKSYKLIDLSKYTKDDVTHVGWYYTAISEGKGTWMTPYKNENGDSWLVSYVTPFYSNDYLVGVVAMDIDFSYFLKYVEDIKLYENGKTMLLTPDEKATYTQNGSESIENINLKAHAKVSLANEMKLLLSVDYMEIQSELRPMIFQVIGIFIIIMTLFIAFAIITTNKIIAPLKKLTFAAEHLLDNDKAYELPKGSNDEIGTLSKVLSDAHQQITDYMSYINALAYKDSMTGIKNTTAYNEIVKEIDAKIKTGETQFAVLVLDINNLKKTNDKYGHDIGNELIKHAADIVSEVFNHSLVYRIGGDEFVVILENDDFENHKLLIEQFDNKCSNEFIEVNDEKIAVSVARGVAVFDAKIDSAYADVFNNADHAMYIHKQETKK